MMPAAVHALPFAVLHGLDLESEHCMFENDNGKVTLVPLGGAQCSVNGVLISEPSQLNQGGTTESREATSSGENLTSSRFSFPLCFRRRYSARQDQHVSVQPSEGGGQATGETKGETVRLDTRPAESLGENH